MRAAIRNTALAERASFRVHGGLKFLEKNVRNYLKIFPLSPSIRCKALSETYGKENFYCYLPICVFNPKPGEKKMQDELKSAQKLINIVIDFFANYSFQVNLAMYQGLKARDIEIPFPQRDVHIVSRS